MLFQTPENNCYREQVINYWDGTRDGDYRMGGGREVVSQVLPLQKKRSRGGGVVLVMLNGGYKRF